MEEVKKKRGRKPKDAVETIRPQELKDEKLQNPPAKLEISQPQPLDPIKVVFELISSLLSSSFKF
jgi:hypothetical protein